MRRPGKIENMADVLKLIELQPALEHYYSTFEISELYAEWSDSIYCAGWMNVTPAHAAEFLRWCQAE